MTKRLSRVSGPRHHESPNQHLRCMEMMTRRWVRYHPVKRNMGLSRSVVSKQPDYIVQMMKANIRTRMRKNQFSPTKNKRLTLDSSRLLRSCGQDSSPTSFSRPKKKLNRLPVSVKSKRSKSQPRAICLLADLSVFKPNASSLNIFLACTCHTRKVETNWHCISMATLRISAWLSICFTCSEK